MNKTSIYVACDRVSNDIITVFSASTDGAAVRGNLPALTRLCPQKDLLVFYIGEVNFEFTPTNPPDSQYDCSVSPFIRELDIENIYKFPNECIRDASGRILTRAEAIQYLGISAQEIIALQNKENRQAAQARGEA